MNNPPTPTLRELALLWLKLGCISFGGPAAHIALMHREIVERRKWLDDSRFSSALGFCTILPGPEAQQLATYIGWMLHGALGGALSGALFVLPSAILLWGLSIAYVLYGSSPYPAAFLSGLMPVVAALVGVAAIRIARRSLRTPAAMTIAALALVLPLFWKIPIPWILIASLAGGALFPDLYLVKTAFTPFAPGAIHKTGRAAAIAFLLWLVPVAGLLIFERGLFAKLAVFFSTTALFSFGGAYVILPYVAQHAVASGWVGTTAMFDGLGLAEATPGPLIIVLQFVGFLTAWNQPGGLTPLLAATFGAIVATWTTFLPSFVWIYLGAPYLDKMMAIRRLAGALAGVTACAVGIISGLACWIAWHAFVQEQGSVDWFSVAVFFAALAAQRAGVLPMILLGGFAGILRISLGF